MCLVDSASVSVRVQIEDECSHPDQEFWTFTSCYRKLQRQFWTFWTYVADVYALTETLGSAECCIHVSFLMRCT